MDEKEIKKLKKGELRDRLAEEIKEKIRLQEENQLLKSRFGEKESDVADLDSTEDESTKENETAESVQHMNDTHNAEKRSEEIPPAVIRKIKISLMAAEKKVAEMVKSAEEQAVDIIEKADDQASLNIRIANDQATEIIRTAEKRAGEIIRAADDQALEKLTEAQLVASLPREKAGRIRSHMLSDAEYEEKNTNDSVKKAEEIINNAKKEAEAIRREAEDVLSEARNKAAQMIKEAESKIISEGDKESGFSKMKYMRQTPLSVMPKIYFEED